MATTALTSSRLMIGGYDFACRANDWRLEAEAAALDATTYCSGGWTEKIAGLRMASLKVSGLNDYAVGQVDASVWPALGTSQPWIWTPDTAATDGSLAYLGNAVTTQYSHLGKVGDIAPFSLSAEGTGWVARGAVLHPALTARTATGNGSANQLGALTAAQGLAVVMSITAVSGTTPTLVVKIQSDDNAGFTTPTDRHTFTSANAVGAQSVRIAGAITDTYWRAVYTIGGTTPSFTFCVAAGLVAL